jgi:hypothetical protein
MSIRTWLISAAGAVALGFIGTSAQAAPIGSVNGVQSSAAQNSGVQEATWVRRCYWHRGHRHCRRYWDDSYGYYGYPYYGPGIGFFFGGGGHRHHFHGHRGHRGHFHGHRGHGRGRH